MTPGHILLWPELELTSLALQTTLRTIMSRHGLRMKLICRLLAKTMNVFVQIFAFP